MPNRVRFTSLVCAMVCAALCACVAPAPHPSTAATVAVSAPSTAPVDVGIIAINDFHGNLLPPHQAVDVPDGTGGSLRLPAGGAAYLASAIDSIRARHPHNLTVSAGDLVSGALFSANTFPSRPERNRIGQPRGHCLGDR